MLEETTEARAIEQEAVADVARESGLDAQRAKVCMLLLTHGCNLACTYCYEKHKSGRMMSFETAQECLSAELQMVRQSERYDWLLVDLFGGEPLLNFPLIQQVVEWAREQVRDLCVRFMISSNGTLLNEEMKVWFAQNKDLVRIGISYDGSEKSQLRNRGRANWEAVQFCKLTWPKQPFHTVISPEMLPCLADDILTSLRQGYRVRAELAGGVNWPQELSVVFIEQLRMLKEAFLQDATLPHTLINRFFKGGEDAQELEVIACGSGTRCTCYDTDAQAYPCQMFTPLCAGERAIPLSEYKLLLPEHHIDPECAACPIRHWCPTCYGMNYIMRGHTARRDHSMCRFYLAQALVTIEFQSEQLMRKAMDAETARLLKFLVRIYQEIETLLETMRTDFADKVSAKKQYKNHTSP